MTAQEFFNKNNNKGLDYDKSFGNQCVDLYRYYVQDVLGFPQSPPVKGAAWIRYNYDPKYYQWVDNTLLAVPQLGDILIWDTRAGGGFGHVAIYVSGNVLSFTSFDLNWPSQGYYDRHGNFIGTGACHYQNHNYFGGLVGWLRPKTQAPVKNWDMVVDRMKNALNAGGTAENKAKEADKIFHS